MKPTEVKSAAALLGSLGGKAGAGRPKNRTKAQSRQMALKGWETRRANGALMKRTWIGV